MRPVQALSVAVPLSLVLGLTSAAPAEPLSGRVLDRKTGGPVEGAVVHVAGPGGFEQTLTSGADGSYAIDVVPGRYAVTFLHGQTRVVGHVAVEAGSATKLDGRVTGAIDEVIVLEDTRPPAVMPQPKDSQIGRRAPPYSDKAIQQDAWTRAWLLLDVDPTGTVTQVKFLKRPGYDLEDIAVREAFKLSFTPARDERDQAIRVLVIWPIEWVANSWLLTIGTGLRTRMPEKKGFDGSGVVPGARSSAAYVPCRGSGPWKMTAVWRGYRDCSTPDLAKAKIEPWIQPPR